ncbi:hypothetical protein WN55_02376, partial [Dufourea novaeangliae]
SATPRFSGLDWTSVFYFHLVCWITVTTGWRTHSEFYFRSHCHESLFYVHCIFRGCFQEWNTKVKILYLIQRVIYYLTIIVKESVGGKDSIKLIPLFQELIPERKCLEYMYERLAGLIGCTIGKIQF